MLKIKLIKKNNKNQILYLFETSVIIRVLKNRHKNKWAPYKLNINTSA